MRVQANVEGLDRIYQAMLVVKRAYSENIEGILLEKARLNNPAHLDGLTGGEEARAIHAAILSCAKIIDTTNTKMTSALKAMDAKITSYEETQKSTGRAEAVSDSARAKANSKLTR